MTQKLQWKKTEALEETVLDEDIEEVATAPAKVMSPTDLLKKQLKEATVADQGQSGRKRIRRSVVFDVAPSELEKECQSYELLPDADTDVNILEWWKNHTEQFPLLSFLTRVVLPVPAASSKSERVFSVAGNVVRPKRSGLGCDKVEDLVTMKCNLMLLKEMGIRK